MHLCLQIKTPPILYELGQRVKLGNSIDLIKALIDQNVLHRISADEYIVRIFRLFIARMSKVKNLFRSAGI